MYLDLESELLEWADQAVGDLGVVSSPEVVSAEIAVRERDDLRRLPAAPQAQGAADLEFVAVVPSGFHQQPAHVTVAGTGDATLTPPSPAARLARHQPEIGGELPGPGAAARVVQFGRQRQGRHGVDAMEASQAATGAW